MRLAACTSCPAHIQVPEGKQPAPTLCYGVGLVLLQMAAVEVPKAQQAPVTRYQGVDKRSSGYKLLAAMGWKEGEGLGAARQGIKEHIKVKKKFENWGVGAVSRCTRLGKVSSGQARAVLLSLHLPAPRPSLSPLYLLGAAPSRSLSCAGVCIQ